jgi:hypothetical protein
VLAKLLAGAETAGADIDAIAGLADGVGALDADRVGEVGEAGVAFDQKARLVDCWGLRNS